MITRSRSVPAKPRSRYRDYSSGAATYIPANEIKWDDALQYVHNHLNKDLLDTITADNIHAHSNKSYLDKINQDLSKTSKLFNLSGFGISPTNMWADGSIFEINKWGGTAQRILLTNDFIWMYGSKVLVTPEAIFENMVSLKSSHGDAVYYNSIWGSGDIGLVTNCGFNVGGGLTSQGHTNTGNMVTDSLSVKGTFNCYELVANKVRATNGYMYVTDSDAVTHATYDSTGVFTNDIGFPGNFFEVGDILLCQTFSGSNVSRKLIRITRKSVFYNYALLSGSAPAVGDFFVKVDSTVESRRTGILLSPYDGGYIDFYKGNGAGTSSTVMTRLGYLDGLDMPGVSGYGLYSNNAYITGDVYAKNLKFDGLIDGNKVDVNTLKVKNLSATDDNGNRMLSINEDGRGSIQRFVNNQLVFEIASDGVEVKLIYYDASGTIKWQLGSEGTIKTATIDSWRDVFLYKYTAVSQIESSANLAGVNFKEFHSGSSSGNQNYNGLTAVGSIADSTPPSAITAATRIADGTYTLAGPAMLDFVDPDNPPAAGYTAYRRWVYTYASGKITSTSTHRYLAKTA